MQSIIEKMKSLILKETVTVRNFMTLKVSWARNWKCRHLNFYTKLVNPRMNVAEL